MKKFLLIILAVIVLASFASCKKNEILKENIDLNIVDFDETITIYLLAGLNYTPTNQEINDWENYMFDRHKVKIDIVYVLIDEIADDFVATKNLLTYEDFIALSDPKGLVYANKRNIKMVQKADLVEPVNKYLPYTGLTINESDKSVKSLTDIDGNIWAVPNSDYAILQTRLYCKEWLEKANMKVPVDVKDYLDFAKFVAFNDPDGNGKDDTYIQEYRGSSIFYRFIDIFHAYGCYPSSFNTIGYNPQTGMVEDMILSNNFPDVMSFFLRMLDEGLIKKGYAESRGAREADYMIASLLSYGEYPDYWEGWEIGNYLIGTSISELSTPMGGDMGYMVLKGTENPADMLNVLSRIGNSDQGLYDLAYGIEGYNYELYDGYLNILSDSSEGDRKIGIGLVFCNWENIEKILFTNKKMVIDGDVSMLEKPDIRYEDDYDLIETTRKLLATDIVYTIPFEVNEDGFTELENLVRKEASNTVSMILLKAFTIEDAVAMYREKMEENGALEMLEEINAGIGE